MAIQYAPDGVTLFYIDANGNKISHNFMEGKPYSAMVDIRSAQLLAVTENANAAANYKAAIANAQISEDAGKPYPPITSDKPRMRMVGDTGVVSYIAFTPPLPDIVPNPTANAPAVTTVSGLVNTTLPTPPDTQAIMYNMVLAMFRKMFPEA